MKFQLNQVNDNGGETSREAKKTNVLLVFFASGMVASSPVIASVHVPIEDKVGIYDFQSESHFSKIELATDSLSSRIHVLKDDFLGNMTSIASALGVSRQMLYEYVKNENLPEDKLDNIVRLEKYSKLWKSSIKDGKTLSRMASKQIFPFGKSFLEGFKESDQAAEAIFDELVKVEMKKQKRRLSSRSRNDSMPIDYLVLS